MKIGWIEISKNKYGGVIYNEEVRQFLSKDFDLYLVDCEAKFFKKIRPLKLLESLVRLFFLQGEKDLWIRDFYSTLTLPFDRTKGKNLVFIHHLDFSGFPFFERVCLDFLKITVFFPALKKADAILTVSEYWKEYFLEKGYKNVFKIYNGFELSNFNITENEVLEFQKKHNLFGKPIIYLGNCQRPKGVVESAKALKHLNAHLVTSGREEVKIEAENFNLGYRDYLMLLKSSSVALAMSKFKEGWCRTANEAMLCKTPVIGSGTGGMKELLEGGGQIICENFNDLKEKVERLVNSPKDREELGQKGFDFAKNYTLQDLKKNWLDLLNKLRSTYG